MDFGRVYVVVDVVIQARSEAETGWISSSDLANSNPSKTVSVDETA